MRRATSGGRRAIDPETGISIHALLAESDRQPRAQADRPPPFLSTLSLRRATTCNPDGTRNSSNFYPRSPCGERLCAHLLKSWILSFLSTLSLRRATTQQELADLLGKYFYPRSPCGERHDYLDLCVKYNIFLSTLSLRRATMRQRLRRSPRAYFYPRSPCGERPLKIKNPEVMILDFYPRSPCGERPTPTTTAARWRHFYPRSPCGERRTGAGRSTWAAVFLSTLSLRRATVGLVLAYNNCEISIHALLAESDAGLFPFGGFRRDFYPRSPCGERQHDPAEVVRVYVFLSTLSLRRATLKYPKRKHRYFHFYPRSPCGERPYWSASSCVGAAFLSTLSLRRATCACTAAVRHTRQFLSTLSLRRATLGAFRFVAGLDDFYPRSPCGERRIAFSAFLRILRFLSTLSLRRATLYLYLHKIVL